MASRYRNDENTIYIQYCRSCDTHSWCTHHDEAKYHETFLKFTEMMAHRMPEVEVIGNMVPAHLIPFKIAENKYIDANTNKYVVYPQIGSFEVTFRGRLVFSKKETHTWPNLPAIVSKVANIVNPEYQSPPKQDQQVEEDKETSKVSNNNSFLDSEEDKKTNYKPQQKGFTLTDHFKMYRPKNTFQEKDWLTEKQESESSCRQISEMGRMESREKSGDKSQRSLQTKKSSDIVGESKLKQLLKSKGMLTKQQGKKEMIIRLDSIQEENIFQEAAAATQRTQEKNIKKNRMKEIDDQINALDNKFKNFEDRVHDIQNRNKQFQMKPGSTADDKSRFKQIIENKRDQMERNLSIKRSRQSEIKEGKEKILLADKTNKLEQYLNYSEQEKNDKLHRIYGERKLMKQFSNKNKKLLKARERAQQQQIDDSESQQSSKAYSHSQSPSSFANIITFKPKNEKILKSKNLRNQKEHKYSSVERYHKVSSQFKEIKNQTDEHFYNNNKFRKPKAEIQSDAQITNPSHHPISRLIKKGVNTLSMNALKSLANNQSNLPKIQSEATSVQNFSTTAKASINKINNRISNIQEKLKNHNNSTFQPIIESPYNADRDRNLSKKSQSRSGSQHNPSIKKINRIYNNGNHQRNSNATLNSLKKNYSHDKIKNSNFSEVARPQTKKINQKPAILEETEEEFKPHQSKRKQAKYIETTEEDPIVVDNNRPSKSNNRLTNNIGRNSRKVSKSNEQQPPQSKQAQIRRSKQVQNSKSKPSDANKQIKDRKIQQHTLTQDQQSSARKTLKQQKSQERLVHNQSSDPKRAFRQRKVHQQKERNTNNQQPRYSQANEQQQNGHQQRQYQYHPHQARQAKPLQRKFKDWRESSPTSNPLKSKEANRKVSKQGINEKIRESDSKQTVIRSKKYKNGQVQQNQSIVSSNEQEIHNNLSQAHAEEKKIRSGQIKKNRTKPKNSVHNDGSKVHNGSLEQVQVKRGQIRKQGQQINQQSERTDENEDLQYSVNNQSEEMRQNTNRFSSQIQYQTNQYQPSVNSSKVTAVNEQKLRKTLGYFKVNQLCYRGVKTSQQNRSGQSKIKQDNQASFYETLPNNQEKLCYLDEEEQRKYDRQVQQEQNEEQNENEEEENSEQVENSSQSQFVPQCKKKEAEKLQKEDPEQGWKGKSDQYENDDQMLPQQMEESHSCRKNSLQQHLQKNDRVEARADEANEVLSVKSQKMSKQAEYSNSKVRPQTTQQVCNPSEENIINKKNQSNKIASEGKEKSSEYDENNFESQMQQPAKVQQVPSIPDKVKKTSSSKPKVKKQLKKQSNVDDVEMETCQQYSQYLQYKISNDLSKDNKDDVVKQQIVDKNEENITPLNEENLQKKSVYNKTEDKEQVVNFMTFEAVQPKQQQQKNQKIQNQQQEQYENEENEIDSNQEVAEQQQVPVETNNLQKSSVVNNQNVPKEQLVKQAQINDSQQPKNEQLVQSQHKQQISAEIQKIKQVKSGKTTPAKKEKSYVISPPLSAVSNSITLPQQTTAQQSHTIQTATPKVSSTQPIQPSSPKIQTKQQPSTNKQQILQNNVYCDSKAQASPKFMQFGVQKQLTLQVSIQTDSQQHQNDTVIIPTPFTPFKSEEQAKKTYRSHENRPFDNIQSEFEGTIRNNYLNQTKNSFRPERKEPLRAKITNQIHSDTRQQEMQKFANIMTGKEENVLKEEGAVTKLSAVYTGCLMNERSLEVEHIRTKFTKLLKVIQILAERGEWILTRLFQDPKGLLQEKAFGVWLCRNFQWECFILDDYIQVDETNNPLFTYHAGNQKWANVLEKAVASAFGGYEQLNRAQAADIFSLLTGCNSISVRVKQDPSKNSKLLQLINDCQRKNYIVHAQKSWQRTKDLQRESIYYVLSVRRANGEDEALLEVSQDGRESFWMRLSKFTQQFCRVEILQLRVNHSFNHIDIGVGKENQLTVIELAFQQSGQGCVTLTYVNHVGALTAYLYKEEKSKVLKLVGQAREKQKSHLFFQCNFSEGRYYIFAQTKQRPARLCYYGENSPTLRITEQIHNDGLKNEVAEYLPIKDNKEARPRRQMEQSWNDWRGKTPRLKDNFMQSRLRENFVEYILGHNKRKDAQF